MMNQIFIVIKRYRFLSMVIVAILLTAEIFMVYKFVNAPFGRDVRMDTGKVDDLYWPVYYDDEEEGCLDCPKKWRVGRAKLPAPFIFEDPDREDLRWVREQVYPIVDGYQNDFDLIIRLMDYIYKNNEFASSISLVSPANSYFEMVKNVLKGGKHWCGHMAGTMITASLSLGRNARLIHFQLAPDGSSFNPSHVASEIWLFELKKWVLFDPTLNVYYLYQGKPASTLEVHKACVNEKVRDIEVIKEGKRYSLETFNDKPFFPEVPLERFFTHFQVIFRNNFLESNGTHASRLVPKETFNYILNWVDERTPAFYFKQELPAFSVRIGVLLLNGIIIVFLSVGLSVNRNK